MHPVRLRCKISEYPDIPAILRLVGRASQRAQRTQPNKVGVSARITGFERRLKLAANGL